MVATREMRPTKEAQSEPTTKATAPTIPPQADIQAVQLSRIEDLLDRVIRSLDVLARAL